jgi:SulP family sulfate permease
VSVVGPVRQGCPWRHAGSFLSRLADLAIPAFFIALINYVQSLSVAQLLAARRQETVDPDRELLALGLCNVAAGLAGGFPVTGGLSRSVVNADAGANSQLASLVTAAGMLLLMLLATAAGPAAAAGAGCHHHCFLLSMLNVASLRRAWLAERADAVAWLLTFGLVLLLGVDSGIMAGVMVSLTTLLWRSSRPHIAVLGRVPGTHHFRNRERHTVECLPGVLLLRVDESLYFGNARQVRRPCWPGWGRGWGATTGAGDECGQPGGYHGIVHAGRAGSGPATSGGGSASGRNQGAGGGYPAAHRPGGAFCRTGASVHAGGVAGLAGPADYQI